MTGDEVKLGEKVTINTQLVLTEEETRLSKRILRKLDTRLLPMIVILYISSFMDRSNIGAALVNGLVEGMKLDSKSQGLVTSIFYVFYVTLELPSNVLLKKFKPKNWFAFISISWSVICMLQAAAKSPALFIVFRALLGAVESGFSPGMITYLPFWYTREELGLRMSIFFGAIPVSGIIGNPIAAGLASLKTSLKPYQMIFLVEGAVTLVFSVMAFFVLENYPETCSFLSTEEKELLVRKLKADQGLATQAKLSVMSSLKAIFDWKTIMFCIINLTFNNCTNLISVFGPTLMRSLGYSKVTSTYLTTIPCAAGLLGIIVYLFMPKRIPLHVWVVGTLSSGAVFLALLAFGKGLFLRMFSFTFIGLTSYTGFPILHSWISVNQGGISKRLVVSAIVISVGNLSGVIIPPMFTTGHAPKFVLGFTFILAFKVLAVILTLIMAVYFKKENQRRTKNPVDVSHLSEDEQQLMFDNHPQFRYTL